MIRKGLFLAALFLAYPVIAAERENLGVFGDWGAFRDKAKARCYAIAKPVPSRLRKEYEPFASVGNWPKRNVRGQLHIRLARRISSETAITLRIGRQRFDLTGGGGDAWAQHKRMDAAIVAAMRSASRMTVTARDENGRSFSNSYDLEGAATAMDAATVGCARLTR